MNDQPLFANAAEQAAYRLALIRSLTPEGTGLSIRRHNRLIKLLEKLASESFSDGEVTQARVKVVAESLCCDRSTIFRILKDAREVGLMEAEPRHGAIGQQISSERTILWANLKELVAKSRQGVSAPRSAAAQSATGASQLRRGGRNCDGGVATATPCITDNPYIPDSYTKSGGADQKRFGGRRRTIASAAIRDDADRLFRRMAYTGKDGHSLWLAAAAVKLGLLDERSVATAAALAGESGKGPGWFRVTLADKAGMSREELTELLGAIRITPQIPGTRPAPDQPPDRRPAFRAPPAADQSTRDQEAAINARRNAWLAAAESN
jgi:hypothetical protein